MCVSPASGSVTLTTPIVPPTASSATLALDKPMSVGASFVTDISRTVIVTDFVRLRGGEPSSVAVRSNMTLGSVSWLSDSPFFKRSWPETTSNRSSETTTVCESLASTSDTVTLPITAPIAFSSTVALSSVMLDGASFTEVMVQATVASSESTFPSFVLNVNESEP